MHRAYISRKFDLNKPLFDIDNFGNALTVNINVQNASFPCERGLTAASTAASSGPLNLVRVPMSVRLEELVSNQGDLLIDENTYKK